MTAADKIAEARVLIEPLSVQRLLVNGRLEDPARIVAALADLADAMAQENAKLREALREGRELIKGDAVGVEWKRGCRSFVDAVDSLIGDRP